MVMGIRTRYMRHLRLARPACPSVNLHLPTYLLYADTRGIGPLDVMHWESIAERSQLHDWEIRPHRHESLLQVLLIEQRLLPHEFKLVGTRDFRETAAAIRDMVVRGAGAIGATAAYGLAQGARAFRGRDLAKFQSHVATVFTTLAEARPTAVDPVNALREVRAKLAAGTTALTGETGAGKTLVVGAIDLLLGGRADPVLVRQDMLQIQHTMWNYAGVVRSPKRLTRARRILLELREEIQSFYRGCQLTRELIELRNAVQTALLVVHAASLNPTSRGCHYLVDGE